MTFSELFTAKPLVFISKRHPLADKESINLEELDDYPCLSFEQGQYNSFYFSEEILSTRSVKKSIKVSDREAIVNF
ncbi:LysR substrate-binding domain-containing protein, partial [Peribacillus frigoritolerans]|uniref:LysR substrate-binding domain-containing protein n=1 Tax=Peribacillus frigoritolerans TaxID=450367 RepID=UPI0028934C74